ncbi:MAG TPA: alanine dehydrogenase, partial [Planctomycetota bacterium]|nr:alanine dehydrogenase [Planctomycetota bacterium]
GDVAYQAAGARIAGSREEVFAGSDMILKVKEPLEEEFALLTERHIVFTYFHFASSRKLTDAMLTSRAICIAYETVEAEDRSLPLLIPMSEVAGRMAIQEGAKFLEKPMEGRGILLAGVPGVAPATVVIIGGGIVGANAARIAAGLGATTYILDINLARLRYLSEIMPPNVITLMSNPFNIAECLTKADLVVGAILIPGAMAPKLIKRADLKLMKRRAVLVDVAIDQGGCAETSRPTTHSKPIYLEEDIVHYCVANIPGAVGTTSTYALTNVTLPYALSIANKGWAQAARDNSAIRKGLNVARGQICYKGVSDAFGLGYTPVEKVLAGV